MKNIVFCILCFVSSISFAQRMADPLTIQGIGNNFNAGTLSKATAGSMVSYSPDGADFFLNPSLLMQTKSYNVRAGAGFTSSYLEMKQDWIPNRLYGELSIIFENDQTFKTKAFDDLKPDWNRTKTYLLPSFASINAPFEIAGLKFAAGAAFNEAIRFDHYFKNNNALDPNIGQFRPAPIPRVIQGDSLKMKWYSYENERTGSIYGYTGALAARLTSDVSAGVSLTYFDGKSDDRDYRSDRGIFMLGYSNLMRLDSTYYNSASTGESEYSGMQIILGADYQSDWYSAGASVNLPMKLTRDWSTSKRTDNGTSITDTSFSGSESIQFPLTAALGITLLPTNSVSVSINYEIKGTNNTEYTNSADSTTKPFLNSSSFSAGIDYRLYKWLKLRGGYRDAVQTFAAEGAGLLDEPVSGSLYSAGVGLTYLSWQLDLSYEYFMLEYQDAWLSNINYHSRSTHSVTLGLGYKF